MQSLRSLLARTSFAAALLGTGERARAQDPMPHEDVVDVPAIGAGLCLSNLFQSHMVLQRDRPIVLWGWASPGETVTVSFAGETVAGRAGDDRAWQVALPAVPASSEPRTLTVLSDSGRLELFDVLVGDVWVLGGQSNMEFEITKVDDGMLEVASANFPRMRLLTVPQGKGFESVRSFERLHEWSDWSGRHFRKGDWEACSPATVTEFSAIGYVFGRRVHCASDVPIGLIDVSVGGTTVETWTPREVVEAVEAPETRRMVASWAERIAAYDPQADLEKRRADHERSQLEREKRGEARDGSTPPTDLRPGPVADRNRPGYCYASMIRPLEHLAVAGALFHQGYNNCFDGSAGARMYEQVFGLTIAAWRRAFDDEALPFCVISLCTDAAPQTWERFSAPMVDVGPLIREAQHRTYAALRAGGDSSIGFVSSYDLRKAWYHPQIKIPVGERAAKWALATRYGLLGGRDREQYWLPPEVEEVVHEGNTIRLRMSTQIKTADDRDGRMLGFAIAGEDRVFHPATIEYFRDGTRDSRGQLEVQRNTLVLCSPHVPEPMHYRYAWARNPLANLVSSEGVPLPTQRSDDWILEETPRTIEAPANLDAAGAARFRTNRERKLLEEADLLRRFDDAQRTVEELKAQVEQIRSRKD